MTGAELIDALGRRVEDEEDASFSITHKLQALNTAQKTLVNLLDNYYLSFLKTTTYSQPLVVNANSGYAEQEYDALFTAYSQSSVLASSPTDGSLSTFTLGGTHSFQNDDIVLLSDFTEAYELNGITGVVKYVGVGASNQIKFKGILATTQETTGGTITRTTPAQGSKYFIEGVTGTSPTDGNPTVFTKTGHTLVDTDIVELTGFTEMTDVNGLTGIVEGVDGNNFSVKGVLGSPAETTGGTVTKVSADSGSPIRDGITRLYDKTNKRFAKLVPEMKFMPSTDYSYGTLFCIEGNKIIVSPSTCASVDIYYLKHPTDLADSSTECEFGESIEPILLDLAESEIFFADNRQNRGNLAYQRAFQQIQILNQRLAELE